MATPKKKLEEPAAPVIAPVVKFEGNNKPHILQSLLDNGKPLKLKAVGVCHIPGTRDYVAFTAQILGDKLVKLEVDEPNLRAIAEESAKISFVDIFMGEEF